MLLLTEEQIKSVLCDFDVITHVRRMIIEKLREASKENKINVYIPKQGEDDIGVCTSDKCEECRDNVFCNISKKFFGEDHV